MLNKAEEAKLIAGLPMARGKVHISHLFFADGCMMFCKAADHEWSIIRHLISMYEAASRQRMKQHQDKG